MIRNHINLNEKKKRVVAITAATITVMLVASIATIGTAPLSVQQQTTERTSGPRITSGNIVDGEVTNDDLADNAVTTEKIQNGQVTTEDLAGDAVTSDKIADGEVTSADVADGSITSTDIAEGTIPPASGTPDDNSVTSAKIADGEVKSADIGDGQVTTQDLANGAVTRAKIASGAIQLRTDNVAKGVDLPPGSGQTIIRATCPVGYTLTGGGFTHNSFGGNFAAHNTLILNSYPDESTNTWVVTAHNLDNQYTAQVTSYAVCTALIP